MTANCICEIHFLALDGFNLNTVHKLGIKEKNVLAEPRFQPGVAGWDARMQPLCYATPPPPLSTHLLSAILEIEICMTASHPRLDLGSTRLDQCCCFVISASNIKERSKDAQAEQFFCRFCVSVFVASSVTKLISKEGVDFKQKLRHVLYDVASTSVRACVRVCVCVCVCVWA